MRKLLTLGLAALTLAAAGAASAQPRPYGDRDRDGVPNAYDNRNDNRGPMGDRDHDGVPNAWDNRWGPPVEAPRHWNRRNNWNNHVRACFNAHRSYNPRTDTYIVRRGVVARCRL